MRCAKLSIGLRAILAIFVVTVLVMGTWAAAQETTLYSFTESRDGDLPRTGLVLDPAGNLYGTIGSGDTQSAGNVFELTPNVGGGWTKTVLHHFSNSSKDGEVPQAGLTLDAAGNLYGTTELGGAHAEGTVFQVTHKTGGGWVEKILHSFGENGKDGKWPLAGLILDSAGNLYGTTYTDDINGYGTVFEVAPRASGGWSEKVLHSFNGTDGASPQASLIFDATGSLYGTTYSGGAYGDGTVFELSPKAGGNWTETVLHSFDGADGNNPLAGLIFDTLGNLFGTTLSGGAYGDGTVFELSPQAGGGWTENVLHNFDGNGLDGYYPYAGVLFDAAGNLYGTTMNGGAHNDGTIVELTPQTGGSWTEAVLHSFPDDGTEGFYPGSGLIFDTVGNLYGTTIYGGHYDKGTVFKFAH